MLLSSVAEVRNGLFFFNCEEILQINTFLREDWLWKRL